MVIKGIKQDGTGKLAAVSGDVLALGRVAAIKVIRICRACTYNGSLSGLATPGDVVW